MSGRNKNEYAEVKFISADGMLLDVNGTSYFAAFKNFPYLYDLPVSEAYHVEYLGQGDIRWENADIDLNVEILENPSAYPKIMQSVSREAAALFGKRGGASRSARKTSASRLNGRKGGRPKKKPDTTLA
ncbi:MAG: hypothetical protein BWY31_01948 [Lentisphaerae bacterium ADurb.Bin242]|nr:MAG: hypothetical protein BWY31_01948 [Lentisphaerae bacterium ADurb.Bin242]